MNTPTDKQVLDYIDSVPGLRDEWGITGSKRLGTLLFVAMNLLLLVLVGGAIAYFALVEPKVATNRVSGLIIVIVLTFVVSGLRIIQLKAERKELPEYRKALAAKLTGDPEGDVAVQDEVARDFTWSSLHYQRYARMIGIAALCVIGINTYQIGGEDFARILLFDAAILAYLAGALWANFAFKADILEVELEERSRATIVWQREHPGQAEKEEGSGR